MSSAGDRLRIAVLGGGPAGSFFALYALKYAGQAGRDLSITIYEGKDFRRLGPPGCNMCAGIVPASDLGLLADLGVSIPSELILSRISSYSLHTSAGTVNATQPDLRAEVISVYRGSGPKRDRKEDLISFDDLLLEESQRRGAVLRREFAAAVQGGAGVEVFSQGKGESYDLVVLATGVNGRSLELRGFDYSSPPTGSMCQAELYLGRDEVRERLGSAVHIFLTPDSVASYGILIPKGPFVTVSLLNQRREMRSLREFLALRDVKAVLGDELRPSCGCLPRISVGAARGYVADHLVAIGDASVTRLYKNGIGSALATAERAAWTAVHRGCRKEDFAATYVPLCRTIHRDNRIGRLLFLQVPMLKRFGLLSAAHHRLATGDPRRRRVRELHAQILWGMFTGAYSYGRLMRMALNPRLVMSLALAMMARDRRQPLPEAP